MRGRFIRLAVLTVLLALAPSLAGAQTDVPKSQIYVLTDKSQFEEGCFGPCLCPVLIAGQTVGTFKLTFVSSDPLYTYYTVTDVNWLVPRTGGDDLRITGSGTYKIGGEFALMQELQLDLKVGSADVQKFDSGLVQVGAPFPAIDVTISVNGMTCFDTVVHVVAQPLAAVPIASYTMFGSSFLTGCFGPCECAVTSQPVTGKFSLVKIGEVAGIVELAVLDLNGRILSSTFTTTSDGIPMTGFGIYELAASPAQQRLFLDLAIDSNGPQRFDSGWVAGGGNLRRIDVALAANGFACSDQVLDLHAKQLRQQAIQPAYQLMFEDPERAPKKPIPGP